MRRVSIRMLFYVVAAVIAVAAIAITFAYQRDIRASRARVAEGGRVVDTACGPIQYAEAGAGPPLLMVHGAGGGYDQGLEFSSGLAERGFRVVAVSRFGYLGTPLPADASAAAQADAHACLLDALGIERAVVLGGSAGAPSSVQLALRHPDRVDALVLLVPALYVPREEGAPAVTPPPGLELVFGTALRFDFLFWAAINVSPGMLVRTVLGTDPSLVHQADAAEQARVGRMLETILPISARRLGLLNDGAVLIAIERYALERITAPTLLISVEDDRYGTWDVARYTAEQIPGARFVGFDRGGHIWAGHHDAVLAAVADFLREHGAERR